VDNQESPVVPVQQAAVLKGSEPLNLEKL